MIGSYVWFGSMCLLLGADIFLLAIGVPRDLEQATRATPGLAGPGQRDCRRERSHQKGSWAANEEGHVSSGGRLLATSLVLQMFQTSRLTPIYRRDIVFGGEEGDGKVLPRP